MTGKLVIRKIYWVKEQYGLDAFYDRCLCCRIRCFPIKSKADYKYSVFLPCYKYRGKLKHGKYMISITRTIDSHYTYVVSKKQIIKYLLEKRVR